MNFFTKGPIVLHSVGTGGRAGLMAAAIVLTSLYPAAPAQAWVRPPLVVDEAPTDVGAAFPIRGVGSLPIHGGMKSVDYGAATAAACADIGLARAEAAFAEGVHGGSITCLDSGGKALGRVEFDWAGVPRSVDGVFTAAAGNHLGAYADRSESRSGDVGGPLLVGGVFVAMAGAGALMGAVAMAAKRRDENAR